MQRNRQRPAHARATRALIGATLATLATAPAHALDGGTVRVTTYNGWRAFEVISAGDNPSGDGYSHAMPTTFDGAGAWLVSPNVVRVQVNHETSDASISEVDLDRAMLQAAIEAMISDGNTGGVGFVISARQAYGRYSDDGGASFVSTTSTGNTSFVRFCSGQAYAPDTFGAGRGFADQLYITGEETSGGDLVVLDSEARDLYRLSGVVGSAPGGVGGMPTDAWENAALVDTGETGHVALLLSPDGGTQRMRLYVGVKGREADGSPGSSFLARNGLAYGSWYYLNGSLPGSEGSSSAGSFDTTSAGALTSTKLEDIDTSPSAPTRVVLGDQDSGVFILDFDLAFDAGGLVAAESAFLVTKVADTSGDSNSLNSPDNVDWTDATTLGGVTHAGGLIFVNEDNSSGELWRMLPDGGERIRIGQTSVGAESTGIFDLSTLLGYRPGSVLVSNNQGTPASMTVLINPDAELGAASCGDAACSAGESASSCPADCTDECGDGACTGAETGATCPAECEAACGDGFCATSEEPSTCLSDCPSMCGDGSVDGSEACDPGAALTESCQSLGFDEGTLACSAATCAHDTSGCSDTPPPVDAGIPGEDAGTGSADAGTGSEDAGTRSADAGTGSADAGLDLPTDAGGCGCRVAASQRGAAQPWWATLALSALALGRARRRRRRDAAAVAVARG